MKLEKRKGWQKQAGYEGPQTSMWSEGTISFLVLTTAKGNIYEIYQQEIPEIDIVRGHSSPLPIRLPIASTATRCLPISVTSPVVFLTEPTTEELPKNFRPAVRLPLILFLFILFLFSLRRDLITPPVIIFLMAPLLFIYYFIVRLRYI